MILISYNIRGLGKKEKRRDVRDLLRKVRADVYCLQESKLEEVTNRTVRAIWGNSKYDWEFAKSEGNSGGIITIWNPSLFQKMSSWSIKEMLVVNGFLIEDGKNCSIINVYAPSCPSLRLALWDKISILAEQCKDDYLCVIGDFNSIRTEQERVGRNSTWDRNDMDKFNNFIVSNSLLDLQLSGRSFTWYRPDGTCKSRLDRMLVNGEWISKWPNSILKRGGRTISDHCPIFIEACLKDWGPKPFRFFNYWMQHHSYESFVEEKWRSFSIHGWGGYILNEKLKLLKGELKSWKEKSLGKLDSSIEDKKEEIEKWDILDDAFGLDSEEAEKRASAMTDLLKEMGWREAQLFQKARIKWTLEGDLNSRFFHKWINSRTKHNEIDGIRVNGSWIDSVQEVKLAIYNHFRSHFDSPQASRPSLDPGIFPRKLDSSDNSFLTAPFSEEEIKQAIWSVDSNCSPGPDGFSFGFFKFHWDLIKSDILQMMNEYHTHGKLVRGSNPSFIALIPKIPTPQCIEDYRPISLIGGTYKILAKVLACRLSRVIGSVIADNQYAFIKGRQILDGIVILNEALDEAKKNKISRVFIKVDFAKAFDSVEWKYLDNIMLGLNFCAKWRLWIRGCFESATASVLVNGSPSGDFPLKRGLRQGDPLSPFLFLLAAEGLSLLTHKACELGLLQPALIGKDKVPISLL